MRPLFSIIVPCYNHAQYLDECLQTVFDQTFQYWECIIVNDGSPDNTKEVALDWLTKDKRFKYLEKVNGGLSDARNEGIKNTTGDYILPLDADDKIGTRYLELAVKEFECDLMVKLVYCEAEYFGDKSGRWELPEYSFKTLLETNPIFCSAIYKRVDFDNTNGYSKELKGFEDWSFWLDLLNPNDKVVKLKQTQFYYRILSNSMVRSMDTNFKMQVRNKIFANHIDIYTEQGINAVELVSIKRRYDNLKKSAYYKLGYILLHPIVAIKNQLFSKK